MSEPSVLYQLVEARLGGTGALAEYVAANRAEMSWRTMAADLVARTGVQINAETLRLWFADRIQVVAKVIVNPPSAGAA
jgi:hypothetical protein